MHKKIAYLFICLFCCTGIVAQQSRANRLVKNITISLNLLKNDTTNSMSISCSKNIQKFYGIISPQNKSKLNPQTVKQLIKSSSEFADGIHKQNCKNKELNSLVDSTKQLIIELKKLFPDSTISETSSTDISKNENLNEKLHVDSLGITKDSTGNFEAIVFLNTSNAAKIKNYFNNLNDSNFRVKQDQNTLIIQLQRDKSADSISKINLPPNPDTAVLNEMNFENRLILGIVTISFFLILIMLNLYVKTSKNSKSTLKIVSGLSKELKTNQPMEEIKNEPQPAAPVSSVINEQLYPTQKKDIELAGPILNTKEDAYFICEVMITAGPRKRKTGGDSINDIDLGEDVCGFISNTNEVFVWLLDGTSDDDALRNPIDKREYFSARLLAQSIGDRLRNRFTEKQDESLCTMIENTINEVKADWLKIIEHLPEEEKKNLKTKIDKKNFPHCSTTALLAYLQKNGNLSAYRVGDSKMLLFTRKAGNEQCYVETSLTENNENGVDRIFFRLEYEDQNFRIVSNNDRTVNGEYKIVYDITENKNIDTIICFSDGIGIETEQLLKQEYKNDPVKAKREIMYQVQGTRDDKSICFIELREKAGRIFTKDETEVQTG
jgi:serine/threonine protein phosphatase PrpC